MAPLRFPSQREFIIVILAIVALSSMTALLYYYTDTLVFGGSAPASAQVVSQSDAGMVYLAPRAAAGVAEVREPVHEVNIANTGLIVLRGARVLSISGTAIRVGMTWGSAELSWAVRTERSTRFFDSEGEQEALDDVQIGDIIMVTGTLDTGGAEPSIRADFVKR